MRRELALLSSAALAAALVGVFGLHKAGLYALPDDRIVVWFSGGVDTPTALRRLGEAGTVLAGTGPLPGMYRVYVMEAGAPRRLARNAWVLREPVDGLAQCFGIDTVGPASAAGR